MQDNSALGRALATVRDLRARCPWDRAQTRESLRPYLVEEALELDHALGEGETSAIRDELSDLMLHLAFQLVIAEELGEVEGERARRRPAPTRRQADADPNAPGTAASDSLVEEVGDLLFAVVNLARKAGVQPGPALDRANRKFRDRFEAIERLADARGIEVHGAGLGALDRLMDEVKACYG